MIKSNHLILSWQNSVAKALWSKFSPPFLLLVTIVCIGTIGYSIIEGWSLFEGLYMTVITIATVGFHEVHALSHTGKLFTIFIIFAGIGIGGYAIGNIASFLVGGEARRIFMEGMLEKKLAKLKDHIIILGYGKFGKQIVKEISKKKAQMVIIEQNEKFVQSAQKKGLMIIQGNAADESILEIVGIRRAKGLIAALSSETDNVFAVLTARVLNTNLRIVSRGETEESETKLLRAGANRVVLAYQSGGKRMAAEVLHPNILDFQDIIFSGDDLSIELVEIHIEKGSTYDGKMIKETNIRSETDGSLIIGIKDDDGKIIPNPRGTTVLKGGDILVVMCPPEHFMTLEKLAEGK